MINLMYSLKNFKVGSSLNDLELLNSESEIAIKRLEKKTSFEEKIYRVGILSDFTCEPVIKSLQLISGILGIDFEIIEFQIEQIESYILNSQSELFSSNLDILLIYPDYDRSIDDPEDFGSYITMSNQILDKWLPLWEKIEENSELQIIQHKFLDSTQMRKKFMSEEIEKTLFQVNKILQEKTARHLIWVDVEEHFQVDENRGWLDMRLLEMARIPFKISNIPHYIFALLKAIRIFFNQPLKLIIVDLDGTLWSNNLAEEGPDKMVASKKSSEQSKNGVATFLKNCGEKGVLLAICSKNNLDDVLKVMNNLENFPLVAEDFVYIKANWESKTKNVLEIISKLQFSQESVCFIDNSIEQCAEIKSSFPKMLVVHSDEFELASSRDFFETGIFEFKQLTKEDLLRKKSYVVNKKFFEAQASNYNLEDFLIGLEMSCMFSEIAVADMPRINQMLERTNQFRANKKFDFNLQGEGVKFLKFELVDKYTSYGIVSIIATSLAGDSIIIDQWLMSCRVFGRGLESKIIEILLKIYGMEFPQELRIDFIPNDRNDYLQNSINSLGFRFDSAENIYVCPIDSIRNTLNYISHNEKNF